MASITLDGQLTDWTPIDRIDFGTTGASGFKVYGRVVDGIYHFAIESNSVLIGANSTIWLNTDQDTATGYKIWDIHLGADYKIEFIADSNAPFGARPALYSVAADGAPTLVEGGLSFAYSSTGTSIELAIDKTKIPTTPEMSGLIDINDNLFLPLDYSQAQFTVKDEIPTVRTDTTLKVGIVFSETSANKYFSETAYSQLIMTAQSQAASAGIPFDILTESDLTNLSKVVNYDALIFPSFGFVPGDKLSAIEDVLTDAANKYGVSLVAAGNFMTNDETGAALSGDPYARMKSLLGVERKDGNNVAEVTVTGSGGASAAIIGYGEGELIRTYSQNGSALVGTSYFDGVSGGNTQVLAVQSASDGTHNAVLATQTGSNNVFFATEGMLADSNMLQHAIGWAARPLESPELKLQMGRQESLFATRTDLDQSQEVQDVSGGIYDALLPILEQWKAEFNFVGSYYVNIGNNPGGGQTTDWTRSKPFYDQLLASGNEIGSHSYTHPENTNVLSPEQIEFEFNQSKLLLQEMLGITVEGAAVPGAPETLTTSKLISPYFSYMSGGYTGVGAGYPGAFGFITPDSDTVYLAPNMKFDFSMVEAAPEFGGGMTPEQAKQEWIREYNELSLKSDLPVFVWPWHDYGPTQWVVNEGVPSPYTEEMYTEFLRYAFQQDAEFVTLADLAQRIKAFEQAGFNYSFDSASNTITAVVTANQIGTFALDVEEGKTIASVSGWYAYDNDSVFMDTDGGTYSIKLGSTPEDVTHITALPTRAKLLSVTGDKTNISFALLGEGKISIDLTDPTGRLLTVTGADIVSQTGDKLELNVSGNGQHTVSVKLVPKAVGVALSQDTGISVSDGITSNGVLNLTNVISGATVEYSLDNDIWTASFTPTEGPNTVYVRQTDTAGTVSAVTTFSFVLDRVGPTASVELPPLNASGESLVTITFSEVPADFDPETDLQVAGGTLTGLTPDGTGKIYTGTFKALASYSGAALVALKASSYSDNAGNAGAAGSATQGADTNFPTVSSIQLSDTFLKAGETAAVTIVFSESVTGFSNADVTVENGTLSNLVTSDGGTTWRAVFKPNQDVEDLTNIIRVTGSYTDFFGNEGSGSNSGNYGLDTKSPTLDITASKIGSGKTIQAAFAFSGAMDPSSFTKQDVHVTGASLKELASNGEAYYTAILTPLLSGSGKISLSVNDATYADINGNAGIGVSKIFDVTKSKPTSGADWIVGSASKNNLRGGNGDDFIRGGKGNDTIIGDSGRDLLDFSDGTKGIKVTLSQNNTQFSTFDGRSAGLGKDKYRDVEGVIGTKFDDKITGSSSSDTLAGLGGNDLLRGSRGNDTFVFESSGGRDRIMDFEDRGRRHDKLDVSSFDFDLASNTFAAWKTSHVRQEGRDTVISFDADTSVKLMNVKAKTMGFDDFFF